MSDNITDTEKQERIRTGNGNLIPPVKGEIRNPAGKPKGTRNRSTIIREIIEVAAAEALKSKSGLDLGVQPQTIFDQLVLAQVIKASLGDTAAFKEIADGAFGKVTDKLQQTVQYKKMGRVIAQPVNPDPSKPAGAPQAFALTFDVGEDPLSTTEEEELDDNEQE